MSMGFFKLECGLTYSVNSLSYLHINSRAKPVRGSHTQVIRSTSQRLMLTATTKYKQINTTININGYEEILPTLMDGCYWGPSRVLTVLIVLTIHSSGQSIWKLDYVYPLFARVVRIHCLLSHLNKTWIILKKFLTWTPPQIIPKIIYTILSLNRDKRLLFLSLNHC